MSKISIESSSTSPKSAARKGAWRMKPDHGWIRARKELLRQVKSAVAERIGEEPGDVRNYRLRYEREFRGAWRAASKAELMKEIERVDFVFGGDFHALGQSQRTHLKILRSLSHSRPVVLALECFPRSSQRWLDLFLSGVIDLDELRRKTRWRDAWGFPWENYRPLLELAKKRGFALLALNDAPGSKSHTSLAAREVNAARCLVNAYRAQPGALFYVIFGDLHLAEKHLPEAVRKRLAAKSKHGQASARDLIIHLNSDRIYFQLAQKGLELTIDVVKLSRNRYCVLSSPPWLQWQSYLLYLEKAEDTDLARDDDHEDDDEVGEEEEFDPTDQIAGLVRLACHDLGIEIKIDDLSVYSADGNAIWRSIERRLKAGERVIARRLLAGGRSFFLPEVGIGFLARPTVNHAASLAGQYIHAKLARRKRPLWTMPNDFSALIWSEAAAYYISKLINHKRQSETLSDLRAQLAVSGPKDRGREAMKLALDRFMSELVWARESRRRSLLVRPRQKTSYLEAARILGGMMGERLYMAHRSRKLSKGEIVQLLKTDVTARSFAREYERILRVLLRALGEGIPTGTKSRPERL